MLWVKYSSVVRMVLSWIIVVNDVMVGEFILRLSRFLVMVRWLVLDMGRNLVSFLMMLSMMVWV